MALGYSIDEAEARFSEVIRQVREGKTVTVSRRVSITYVDTSVLTAIAFDEPGAAMLPAE